MKDDTFGFFPEFHAVHIMTIAAITVIMQILHSKSSATVVAVLISI
jgi:hypothetical protein